MSGIGQNHTSDHKCHVIGGVWHKGKEGGETMHQPEHSIWPSAQEVHRLPTITARGTGEVGDNIQRVGPD